MLDKQKTLIETSKCKSHRRILSSGINEGKKLFLLLSNKMRWLSTEILLATGLNSWKTSIWFLSFTNFFLSIWVKLISQCNMMAFKGDWMYFQRLSLSHLLTVLALCGTGFCKGALLVKVKKRRWPDLADLLTFYLICLFLGWPISRQLWVVTCSVMARKQLPENCYIHTDQQASKCLNGV